MSKSSDRILSDVQRERGEPSGDSEGQKKRL